MQRSSAGRPKGSLPRPARPPFAAIKICLWHRAVLAYCVYRSRCAHHGREEKEVNGRQRSEHTSPGQSGPTPLAVVTEVGGLLRLDGVSRHTVRDDCRPYPYGVTALDEAGSRISRRRVGTVLKRGGGRRRQAFHPQQQERGSGSTSNHAAVPHNARATAATHPNNMMEKSPGDRRDWNRVGPTCPGLRLVKQ